ncbi:MAG TPA: hypothetical protein VII06_27555 [Chloroflexota bacterium]|jgi:hypothetical protein
MGALDRLLEGPRALLARVGRPGGGARRPTPLDPAEAERAGLVRCPNCEGTGLCRTCNGAGEVERLVAISGGEGMGFFTREPVHTMKVRKCHACPHSNGTCKTCQGRGAIPAAAPPA